jgi:hypothetical protein
MPADKKTIMLGDASHGTCFDDDGGPAFIELADGSWRVFGANGASDASCTPPGTSAYVPHYLAWAEQMSGFDLTPCHDAATGAWSPGPSCTGVPLNPDVSDGTWAQMCTENLALGGPLTMCGAPGDAGALGDAMTTSSSDGAVSGGGAGAGGGGDPGGGLTGAGGDFPNGRPIRLSNKNQIGTCMCRVGSRERPDGAPSGLATAWSLVALVGARRRRRTSN